MSAQNLKHKPPRSIFRKAMILATSLAVLLLAGKPVPASRPLTSEQSSPAISVTEKVASLMSIAPATAGTVTLTCGGVCNTDTHCNAYSGCAGKDAFCSSLGRCAYQTDD